MNNWYWDNKSQDFYRLKELPYKEGEYWTHFCEIDGCFVVSEIEKPCCSCKKVFDEELIS